LTQSTHPCTPVSSGERACPAVRVPACLPPCPAAGVGRRRAACVAVPAPLHSRSLLALPAPTRLPAAGKQRQRDAALSPETQCLWGRQRTSSGCSQGRRRLWSS
jgi:hypothetical protein